MLTILLVLKLALLCLLVKMAKVDPLISHSNDKYDWSQLDNVGEIRVEVYYGQTVSPKETAPDSAIRLVSSKQRFNPDFKLIGTPKKEFENDSKNLQVE